MNVHMDIKKERFETAPFSTEVIRRLLPGTHSEVILINDSIS